MLSRGDAARVMPTGIYARPFLSRRQRQIILLVGSGLQSKEIARRLGITRRTVIFHLDVLYRKLGYAKYDKSNRYKLLIWARDNRNTEAMS
jgi:DNA-binding NarL/FixJ family response regulator